MIIAQITDFHVRPPGRRAYGGVDTNAMLHAAVAKIAALDPAPDCVICTGDLTDCGLPEEYAEIADALAALPMAAYVIPGNHDRREVMRDSLAPTHRYLTQDSRFLHYLVDDFPVRLIALDTVVPGSHNGEICAQREAWLERTLARGNGKPALIFMHHPPFRTGVAAMDAMMCRTSDSFRTLIEQHPNIERVVAGHYHRPIVVRWAGTIGFVAPSTAHQVALDLRETEPTRLVMEPPGLALHVHREGIGIASHVVPIGDFGPIRDFELDPDYPGQK
ncbi:MAG TPA: phosphodiesterase [Casimicrobiaceae bacterium]